MENKKINTRHIFSKLKEETSLFAHIEIVDNFIRESMGVGKISNEIVVYYSQEAGGMVGREVMGFDSQISGHELVGSRDYSFSEIRNELTFTANGLKDLERILNEKVEGLQVGRVSFKSSKLNSEASLVVFS